MLSKVLSCTKKKQILFILIHKSYHKAIILMGRSLVKDWIHCQDYDKKKENNFITELDDAITL